MLTSWGYEVTIARDGMEAYEALRAQEEPCVAILDWTLPALDGIDMCRRLRDGGPQNYVYTILLSERRPIEDLLEAMDAGADDYLFRPLKSQEVRARVRVGSRVIKLQEHLVKARAEIYDQSARDPLTGIWNRTAAIEMLDNELSRGARAQTPLAIILCDLDHMKRFNAEFGYQTGDAVLRAVAARLGKTLRKYDSVGRYGGEEFLIILPNCPCEASASVADRLRRALTESTYVVANQPHSVSCSLGVAWTGDCRVDAEALLAFADGALSMAKRNGRNRVEMARSSPPAAEECPDQALTNS